MSRQIPLADTDPIGCLQDPVNLLSRKELGNHAETDVVSGAAAGRHGRNSTSQSRALADPLRQQRPGKLLSLDSIVIDSCEKAFPWVSAVCRPIRLSPASPIRYEGVGIEALSMCQVEQKTIARSRRA